MGKLYKILIGLIFFNLINNYGIAQSTLIGKPTIVSDIVRNQCPSTTFNLNSVIFQQPGDPYVLRWHTGTTPSPGNQVANPNAASGGTYYAFFYNTSTSKYSEASLPVTTETNACTGLTPSTLPKFQIIPLTTNNFSTTLTTTITTTGTCSPLEPPIGSGLQKDNLINSNLTDYSNVYTTQLCNPKYSVSVPSSNPFPSNTYAGFSISKTQLTTVNNYKIILATYNNGTLADSVHYNQTNLQSGNSISDPVNTTMNVGFVSSNPFNEVRISFEGIVGGTIVYYAFVGNFPPTTLKANVLTPLTTNNFGVTAGGRVAGLIPVGAITNVSNIVKPDTTTGIIATGLSAGVVYTVNVRDHVNTYPSGTFAGFTLASPGLLPLSLLGGASLKTYLDGVLQENIPAANLISLNSSLLTGSMNQSVLGIITTKPWNEIQYEKGSTLELLTSTMIMNAFVQRFEDTNPTLTENLPTSWVNTAFPVSINPQRTNVSTLCVNCQVQNPNNVTSEFLGDYASIQMPVAALGATASISVKDQLDEIAVGDFVGFEIENITALNLNLLESIVIRTYNNGVLKDTASGSAQLVGLNLASSEVGGKRIVGFVTKQAADEIQLEIKGGIVGVSLGETRVYRAVVTKFSDPAIVCDTKYELTSPEMPVTLSLSSTGGTGGVCLGTTIIDANNILLDDSTKYALITTLANVLCEASIGIKSHNTLYPNRSLIEFTIEAPNTFLQADLLNYLSIAAYKNNTLVQESSSSTVLNLQALGLFGSNRRYKVSFRVTNGNYDEVRLIFGGVLSAVGTYRVYGATIDTRGAYDLDLEINCCSAIGFKPELININDIVACTDEEFNLNTQLANTCPTNTVLQWRTSMSTANNDNIVSNPSEVGIGTYYAICYDDIAKCFSEFSEPLEIDLDGCCPDIAITDVVNSTACSTNNGSFTITGLRADTTGYIIEYILNGDTIKVNNVTASASGTYNLTGLSAGKYENIRVIHIRQCLDGSNVIDSIRITEPLAPLAPTQVTASSFAVCEGTSTTLSATCEDGAALKWYSDVALTSELASVTVSPTTTSTYYAACLKDNCKSLGEPITIYVNPVPVAPTSVTGATTCPNQTVTITGTCAAGSTIYWFTDASLNFPVISPSPSTTTTYYAACVSGDCKSSAVPVTVTVSDNIDAPKNLTATPQNIIAGGSSTLTGTCSSGTLVWYTSADRTTVLASSIVSPTISTTYYAACSTSPCALVASITVNVSEPQFILSMNAERAPGQAAVINPGQTVTLQAKVENIGNIDATNVQIVAYIPAGLTLNDPSWTVNGNKATLNESIPSLAVGQTAIREIKFIVDPSTTGSLATNFEISGASGGTSIYSTFDNNPDNDTVASGHPAFNIPHYTNLGGTREIDYDQVVLNICITGNCSTSRARRVK